MKRIKSVFCILSIVILCISCASGVRTLHNEEYSDLSYLKEYFGSGFEDKDTVYTLKDFKDQLSVVVPEYNGEGTNVIECAVNAAGYSELVSTYTSSKIKERNLWYYAKPLKNVRTDYFYTFLDTGLGNIEMAKDDKITADEANNILVNVANAKGYGRRYIGFSTDPDILNTVRTFYNGFALFSDETLSSIGKTLLEKEYITGYNLKNYNYEPRFLSDYTIVYSHDDIDHLIQLIALMKSEGIICRIQIEPKVSVYQYLLDWGPIPEPSDHYRVVKDGDMYLVNAIEFDASFEFSKKQDKEYFNSLINKNAKKSSDNPEMNGLIKGSWWQPLYTSRTVMNTGDFVAIVNNTLSNDKYSLNTFTVRNSPVDFSAFTQSDDTLTAQRTPLVVNRAFYNYLTKTSSE